MVYGKTIRLPGEFFDDSKHHLHAEEFVQQLQKQIELLKPLNEKHRSKTKVFVHKDLKTCSHVFIRTDRVKKPLEPPYEGPFPVLDRTDKYFTLKVKGRNVTTSIDRLRPAYLLADSDNVTSEHPTATRPIVSGALPSTSSQQNPDPPDVEKYTEFQGTGSTPDLTRTRSMRIIKKPSCRNVCCPDGNPTTMADGALEVKAGEDAALDVYPKTRCRKMENSPTRNLNDAFKTRNRGGTQLEMTPMPLKSRKVEMTHMPLRPDPGKKPLGSKHFWSQWYSLLHTDEGQHPEMRSWLAILDLSRKWVFWIVFDFYLLKKMDQRTCIKFCVKNEIKCADAFRMLTVAYGEATLDRSNVYRWYKMFSEGREDVNDEERAGRPSTSTTDEKINEV
ncbi:hypothetical protein LAZ67_9002458 [Cordylochernes scorpioides]|uniref:Mos1 transposase HTH domain-containing protein n=1 Tax=Cordylochernes scorpioides TaxID=51811 RepID=A0ABY6KVV4_9ARAC|nr:hypothetical protein LAZ67_9002458 [Cordylochernes scorpioides]